MADLDRKQGDTDRATQEGSLFSLRPTFGAGLHENLKEFFRRQPEGAKKSELFPKPSLRFEGPFRNLLALLSPPPNTTAPNSSTQSVYVKENWPTNEPFVRVLFASVAVHVFLLALIVVSTWSGHPGSARLRVPSPGRFTQISRFLPKLAPAPKKPSQGGGSGGEQNPLRASKGTPPAYRKIQLTPPRVRTTEAAKMAVPPTLIGDPRNTTQNKMPSWGDPGMMLVNASSGPGHRGGIGSNQGLGVGDGDGEGQGPGDGYGTGGDAPCRGCAGTSMPSCLICPRAEYSDEAVKSKYEGIVVLLAVITPDGRAVDVHVSKGLGFGLDAKALEAIRGWRFKPALGPDRKPVAVRIPIEVVFHLY